MGTSKMRVMGLASVMAVALFGFAGLGLAGGPFDPAVKTVVETTLSTNTLTVTVDLMQMLDGAAQPVVPGNGVTIWVEQHFPQSSGLSSGWPKVLGSDVTPPVGQPCCTLDSSLGSIVGVTTYDYETFCNNSTFSIDPTANAIRAVAVVNVTNAKNKTGFLGRSVSIPNPCK